MEFLIVRNPADYVSLIKIKNNINVDKRTTKQMWRNEES